MPNSGGLGELHGDSELHGAFGDAVEGLASGGAGPEVLGRCLGSRGARQGVRLQDMLLQCPLLQLAAHFSCAQTR